MQQFEQFMWIDERFKQLISLFTNAGFDLSADSFTMVVLITNSFDVIG